LGIDPGTDYAGDPDRAAVEAVADLHAATIAAGQLRDALSQARRAITYAHYIDPAGDDPTGDDEAEAASGS